MEAYLQSMNLPAEILPRIRMTAGCTDCVPIPKVPDAGRVFGDYQLMHNGVKVVTHGYCGPWMTAIIHLLNGHHEPQEEWAFHSILSHVRPGTLIIELGCYWSYYSLWYLHNVPDSRAILVEPDPNYLAVGQRNLALNQRTATVHNAAIGGTSHTDQSFRCESDGIERPMRIMTVNELLNPIISRSEMSTLKTETAEVLLADIQGAELEMLHGAAESIRAGRVRFLILSTHHHSISGDPLTHQKCLEFVVELGGTILAEHTVAESFSGDGLIVASFDPKDRDLPRITLSHNRASSSLFRPTEYDLADANAELARLRAELEAQKRKSTWFGRWFG